MGYDEFSGFMSVIRHLSIKYTALNAVIVFILFIICCTGRMESRIHIHMGSVFLSAFSAIAFLVSVAAIIAIIKKNTWLICMVTIALVTLVLINIIIVFSLYTNVYINTKATAISHLKIIHNKAEIFKMLHCCDQINSDSKLPPQCYDESNLKLYRQKCLPAMATDLRRRQITMIAAQSINILIEFFASLLTAILGTYLIYIKRQKGIQEHNLF